MKRRMEITTETQEIWIIRRPGTQLRAWCPECHEPEEMITPDEAAVLTRLTARRIYCWVEENRLHSAETVDGLVLICLNSLSQYMCLAAKRKSDAKHPQTPEVMAPLKDK